MKRWYVLRSKYCNEMLLWQQLCSRGIEVYYPRKSVQGAKFPMRKLRAYFPAYMFVHIDLDSMGRSALQWLPGSMGLLCIGGEPAYITDAILHGIQERVDRTNALIEHTSPLQMAGEEVEIQAGPFTGYHGIFSAHCSDRERATVFLRFIGDQQVRVELPVTQLALTKRRSTPALR